MSFFLTEDSRMTDILPNTQADLANLRLIAQVTAVVHYALVLCVC